MSLEINPITGKLDKTRSNTEITGIGDARYLKLVQVPGSEQSVSGARPNFLAGIGVYDAMYFQKTYSGSNQLIGHFIRYDGTYKSAALFLDNSSVNAPMLQIINLNNADSVLEIGTNASPRNLDIDKSGNLSTQGNIRLKAGQKLIFDGA